MMGIELTGKFPFHTVYLHGNVLPTGRVLSFFFFDIDFPPFFCLVGCFRSPFPGFLYARKVGSGPQIQYFQLEHDGS